MEEGKNNKKIIYIIIAVVLVIAIGVGIYFVVSANKGSKVSKLKEEVVTAENYEDLTNKLEEELKDADEVYYYAYACMYYILKDGFSEEYINSQDESIMYKNIYNKKVSELMEEGKRLMEENDVSVDQWRQQVENLSQMDKQDSYNIDSTDNYVKE